MVTNAYTRIGMPEANNRVPGSATPAFASASMNAAYIGHADQSGHLISVGQVPTQAGARNAVVTKDGTVYLAHAGVKLSALVVVSPSGK